MSIRSSFITAILTTGFLTAALMAVATQREVKQMEGRWQVTSLSGNTINPGLLVTMDFAKDGGVSGSAGCNRFMGEYVQSAYQLNIDHVAATKLSCIGVAASTEADFLNTLKKVAQFSIGENGILILHDEQGTPQISAKPAKG